MNDPTRPYNKVYEIDFDRHSYDGKNWTYLNLPMDSIKAIAIRSIKDKMCIRDSPRVILRWATSL